MSRIPRLPRRPACLTSALLLLATLACLPGHAQDPSRDMLERGSDPNSRFESKEWQEDEAPPPPEFELRRLVPLEMPRYMSLRFGVDPQTMSVTGDGVVRYVVVAHREGADTTVNAFYEGVRCATDEYKTYARYSGGQWNVVPKPEWKRIDDRNSAYTYQLARQSLCAGRAPRPTVRAMIQELRQPEQLRY